MKDRIISAVGYCIGYFVISLVFDLIFGSDRVWRTLLLESVFFGITMSFFEWLIKKDTTPWKKVNDWFKKRVK